MTLAKAKAKTNETFIVQTSLTIITYDRQNMFIVQATDRKQLLLLIKYSTYKCKLIYNVARSFIGFH